MRPNRGNKSTNGKKSLVQKGNKKDAPDSLRTSDDNNTNAPDEEEERNGVQPPAAVATVAKTVSTEVSGLHMESSVNQSGSST
jgi:hypothetical protein